MNNIIYPGSDNKPEACAEVISRQHDNNYIDNVNGQRVKKHIYMSEAWVNTY